MRIQEEWQFRLRLAQKRYYVILHHLHSRARARPAGVSEAGQINQQHLEVVGGKEMCDFVEAARVLSKAMDDREGASGPAGGEFGVVEADVGDLRVKVLLGDEVGLVFKLA